MKVKRVLHLRTPLIVRCAVGKREIEPEIIPNRLGFFGGATVVIEGDTDKPEFVTMKVARCRFNDNYNRKLGIKTANERDPEVVHLRDLPSILRHEEEHMLRSCIPVLRREPEMLDECRSSNFDHIVRHFLPLPKKEKANG